MALGIYISVPFCRTKCTYCNFASEVFSKTVFQRYIDCVCRDIAGTAEAAAAINAALERKADSIYLGGGTPSILEIEQLERLFVTLSQNFGIDPAAEITVECAPGTLAAPVIESLQRCGVNRVSLGVQSFVDQEAASVGRLHNRATVLQDISRLRTAGVDNINIDLIAGLPHQTAESWEASLQQTIDTGVPHVSVYMLEVDDDSRLGRELIAGGTRYHAHSVPDEDLTADLYTAAGERLEGAGVHQYEISNFASAGRQSRHNLKYWTRQPYLGFGVDAHSMLFSRDKTEGSADREGHDCREGDGHREGMDYREGHDFSRADNNSSPGGFSPWGLDAIRFSTPDSLEKYVSGMALTRNPVDRQAALEETFFLGLRLSCGVDLRRVGADFGESAVAERLPILADLAQMGLVERLGDMVRLTPRGRMLSNEVFQRFIAEHSPQ